MSLELITINELKHTADSSSLTSGSQTENKQNLAECTHEMHTNLGPPGWLMGIGVMSVACEYIWEL